MAGHKAIAYGAWEREEREGGAGWRFLSGVGWQKDKKEPSQKLQQPPQCTSDTGSPINRIPDGPTEKLFRIYHHDDASRKQRQD
jgi:hypothetical protein